MKVFYATARGSSDKAIEELAVKTVPSVLKQLGHDVKIYIFDPDNADNNGAFDEIVEGIVAADVFIGEMSRASQTLGFQLSYALNNTKPALYLYAVGRKAKPGAVIGRNPSRLLKVKPYDASSAKHVLENFLSYAEEQLASVRTSFMSTRKIDSFISEKALLLGITKAEVIRQILSEAAESEKNHRNP